MRPIRSRDAHRACWRTGRQPRPLAGVLLLLAAIGGAAALSPPQSGAKEEPFTLAVMRRDGILVPFATYAGKRWKNAWPVPEAHLEAPITLSDIPKRWWTGRGPTTTWTLWPIQGPARGVETPSPTWFPTHCSQHLGLRSTYVATTPVPPPTVLPYPKDGVAVAGPVAISQIELLDPTNAPLAGEIARTFKHSIDIDETRRVKEFMQSEPGWTHPYTEAERVDVPFTIEALYKAPRGLGDRDVYYFEGVKHYAVRTPPRDREKHTAKDAKPAAKDTNDALASARTSAPASEQGAVKSGARERGQEDAPDVTPESKREACDLVTFVAGWVAHRPNVTDWTVERLLPLKRPTVVVTSCDFRDAFIMLPLGIAHVQDKSLWIVQWSGWTHEEYAVLEVQENEVVTQSWTNGGFCPAQ